jgi:catechol 2,3-dioxygenase-like lactoylglutathione lyase family enzyme
VVESSLRGVFAVKLPVSDLNTSRAWYQRVFGFAVEFEFPDEDEVVRGVAGHLPGVSAYIGLREEPAVAAAVSGFNLLNLAVDDLGAVEAWSKRLDELGVEHSPVIDATVGWIIVLHDPDGIELHIYSQQRHGMDQTGREGYGRTAG